MAKEKIMQVVEDDEIENVGIMSGFMDDIDDFLSEIMEEEQEAMSGEDDEMARVTGRTPDSPEILMNNLRGNMRSLDARREELADMVGFSAAEETPDEVLAMLQPVLAQQDMAGIASMLSPPSSGSPRANPELLAPPAPAGGVPSLPMAQGPMPMPPAAPAPAPMQMKQGGLVQHFQDGGEGVSSASDDYYQFPAEVVARAMQIMNQEKEDLPNAIEVAKQLSPEYQAFLGTSPEQAKAQLLMSLGQAAFNYGANVDAQGRPLRGSGVARLAGALAPVPAMIGKTASDIQKQEQAAKALALQSGQAQVSAAQERNTQLMQEQSDLARDILKEQYKTTKPTALEQKIDAYMSTGRFETREDAIEAIYSTAVVDPNTGNMMVRNPFTGKAEVLPMTYPDQMQLGNLPTGGFGFETEDLAFDPGKGVGITTGIITLYNSIPGQLPFLPVFYEREKAVNALVGLQADIIKALASTGRPSNLERQQLSQMLPTANDWGENPEIGRNKVIELVDAMGQRYVQAKRLSQDQSTARSIRTEASERVNQIEGILSRMLNEDAYDSAMLALNGNVDQYRAFNEMTLEELGKVDFNQLSDTERAVLIEVLRKRRMNPDG